MKITKDKLNNWTKSLVESFDMIIRSKDVKTSTRTILASTANTLDIDIEAVNIISNDTSKFFGMSVIPLAYYKKDNIISVLKGGSSLRPIVNGEYIIEIDDRVFDKRLNLTANELTAMFLHEIGHIVFSLEQSEIINKALNRIRVANGLNIGLLINAVTKSNVALNLVTMLLVEALAIREKMTLNLKIEKLADSFAVELGFANELKSLIDKISEAAMDEIESRYTVDQRVEETLKFGLTTLLNMSQRSDELISVVSLTDSAYKGRYIQRYTKALMKTLVQSPSDIFSMIQNINEAVEEEPLEVISESILEKMFGWKRGLYLESDIDDISVYIDEIRDGDDKIEILNMIHKRINTSKYALKVIDTKGVGSGIDKDTEICRINSYIKSLQALRVTTLRVKVNKKKIGVFDEDGNISISYPSGYTG